MVGLVAIAVGYVALSPESPFPGVNALIPCLGTALVLYAVRAGPALRPGCCGSVRWYSSASSLVLDLPLALADHRVPHVRWDPRSTPGLGSLSRESSLSFPYGTWRFVEVPFRASGSTMPFGRVAFRRLALPAIVVGLVAVLVTRAAGLPQRYDPEVTRLKGWWRCTPMSCARDVTSTIRSSRPRPMSIAGWERRSRSIRRDASGRLVRKRRQRHGGCHG